MNRRKQQIVLRWGLVAANMIIIFLFSGQNSESSGELSSFVAQCLERIALLKELLQYVNIRKIAHFTIYFVLGIFTARAVRLHADGTKTQAGAALLICFIYACSDEFHQSFVPGRGPSFWDVLIDSMGALTGIISVLGYYYHKW
ncbi:MAG: VanZ family protein [Lachnospiraceae bacterium]